jgi:hypothetical protein
MGSPIFSATISDFAKKSLPNTNGGIVVVRKNMYHHTNLTITSNIALPTYGCTYLSMEIEESHNLEESRIRQKIIRLPISFLHGEKAHNIKQFMYTT